MPPLVEKGEEDEEEDEVCSLISSSPDERSEIELWLASSEEESSDELEEALEEDAELIALRAMRRKCMRNLIEKGGGARKTLNTLELMFKKQRSGEDLSGEEEEEKEEKEKDEDEEEKEEQEEQEEKMM